MSYESVLKRLGLYHLKDDPKRVAEEVDKIIQKFSPKLPEPQDTPAKSEQPPKPPIAPENIKIVHKGSGSVEDFVAALKQHGFIDSKTGKAKEGVQFKVTSPDLSDLPPEARKILKNLPKQQDTPTQPEQQLNAAEDIDNSDPIGTAGNQADEANKTINNTTKRDIPLDVRGAVEPKNSGKAKGLLGFIKVTGIVLGLIALGQTIIWLMSIEWIQNTMLAIVGAYLAIGIVAYLCVVLYGVRFIYRDLRKEGFSIGIALLVTIVLAAIFGLFMYFGLNSGGTYRIN